MGIGRFYGMVGALLWRPADGRYLVLRRSAGKDFSAGAWECNTGRVDQGEGFSEAVRREVREELGLEVQIDFLLGTAHFYRGENSPENEIIGVQYCCSVGDAQSLRLSGEHAEHRWITAEEAGTLFPGDHWLGKAIQRAETIRSLASPDLLTFWTETGFEL